MTYSLFIGQFRVVLIGLIMYAAGRGWLSSQALGLVSEIGGPCAILFGPWAWSIYSNFNSKLVPHDSVAITKENFEGITEPGAMAMVKTPLVKIVG